MFDGHYTEWIARRKSFLARLNLTPHSVLDLGCGHGQFGLMFEDICDVTYIDGRWENLDSFYSASGTKKCQDLNNPNFVFHDVIIHFGLLYHLKDPLKHLQYCLDRCNTIVLESEVVDSEGVMRYDKCDLDLPDQGLGGGIVQIPSIGLIEKCFKSNGFGYTRVDDGRLNSGDHIYDWEPKNDKSYKQCRRKMWIADS